MSSTENNQEIAEEITLGEIIAAVTSNAGRVVLSSVLGASLAIGAAWVMPKEYEVSFYIDQPYNNQLQELNTGRTSLAGLDIIEPKELYGYFLSELASDSAKYRFFEKIYLPSLKESPATDQARRSLRSGVIKKNVVISEPKPKGRQLYGVKIVASNEQLAVQWAKAFLEQTEAAAKKIWLVNARSGITLAVQNAERDLAEQRLLMQRHRADRRVQLMEALQVARAVGLQGPQVTQGQLAKHDQAAPFADGSQMYARGVKSLEAELRVLSERQDDEPFMADLRAAQTRLKLLKERAPEEKNFPMYRVDGAILTPAAPVFPKKGLFAALGLLAGFFLGVAWAFKRSGLLGKLSG